MNLQKIYNDLLESLKTDSIERKWESIEDKTSLDAALVLFEVCRAFQKIYAEISQSNSIILKDTAKVICNNENHIYTIYNEEFDAYQIDISTVNDHDVDSDYSIKKQWLHNTYDEMLKYAYEELSECLKYDDKIVKEKTDELKTIQEDIDFFNKRIYKNVVLYETLKTQNELCKGDIMLRNRYSIDIRLRPQNSKTKWKFIVPGEDANYIQLNYNGSKDNPTYVSIDPPGGPMLTLGNNKIFPYARKEPININIKKIYEENGGWFLETDEVN